MAAEKNSSEKIIVSVIIPMFNSERFIGGCLDSIFAMDYPRSSYEVIIVDNGSTDRSIEIAKKYDVKVLSKPKVNVSSVRNHGAFNACGEILAFVDSDCLVSKGWLKNALPYFNDPKTGMAGALVAIPQDVTWVARTWNICMKKRRHKGETDRLGCANIIIRRECFELIGGFNPELVTGEDDELCHKIRAAGFKIYSDPEIKVYHLGEYRTLSVFFRKEIWRGYDTFRLFLGYRGRMNAKIVLFSAFFLVNLLVMTLSAFAILVLNKGYAAFFISTALLLGAPSLLALKTAAASGQWRRICHFALLYLVFGIARGLAILRVRL